MQPNCVVKMRNRTDMHEHNIIEILVEPLRGNKSYVLKLPKNKDSILDILKMLTSDNIITCEFNGELL